MKKMTLALNTLSIVAAVGIVVTNWWPRVAVDVDAHAPNPGHSAARTSAAPATLPRFVALGIAESAGATPADTPAAVPDNPDEVVVLTELPTAGPTRNEVNVEWVETFREDMTVRGVLRVNQRDSEAPQQAFNVELDGALPREQISLEFVDLNGDEAQDLVFTHSRYFLGMTVSDVYLWVPKLSKFVKSETLSGPGDVSAGSRPGCVTRAVNCSSDTYADLDICFNQATGRWHTTHTTACRER